MKILVLTSIRSEYDLLSNLLGKLNEDSDIELSLLVGGAHNSNSFGYTVRDIEQDGFNILLKVESLLDSDSQSSRIKSASLLMLSAVDVVNQFSPDLIVYAGDREEVMIGALLGGYLSIPTLHFFGGDHAQDGHIDNPVRHAVSKMSTCHFVSLPEHKKRLKAIGEIDSRIYCIGSVALDKFDRVVPNSDVLKKIAGLEVTKPASLFIFHPVESELSRVEEIIFDSVQAILRRGFHVFIGLPNSDHGNSKVRQVLTQLAENNSVTLYGNLSRVQFVSLFASVKLIAGNSSAGLLEAATLKVPCINIGERQRGRLCGSNVVFADSNGKSVDRALDKVLSDQFQLMMQNIKNPYGDGNASQTAYELIKSIDFTSMLGKSEDPLGYE